MGVRAMNGIALVVALAALGQAEPTVEYLIETTADQQQQYTLQIDTAILKLVAGGEEIHSEVPAEAGQVQRLCIRIGRKRVAHTPTGEAAFRQLLLSPSRWASASRTLTAADLPPTILWPARTNPDRTLGVSFGYQPDGDGKQAYYVQIDPAIFHTLAAGDEIYAPIDPAAGRLARFIVTAGNKQLPQVAAQLAAALPSTQPPARTPIGMLPAEGGRTQYPPANTGGAFAPNNGSLPGRSNEFNSF